jgi:hypothetical protein
MTIQLLIDDPTAARLRELADQRGLSVEDLAQQALAAGLDVLGAAVDPAAITWLGSLHTTLPTAEQVARMSSPIIVRGPVPMMEMTILGPSVIESLDTD